VIGWLRDCHVCNGWALDERGAERTLRYFRSMAKRRPDNMAEWGAVTDFLHYHGQSLDWIMDVNPVSLICKAAARSARAQELQTQLFQDASTGALDSRPVHSRAAHVEEGHCG
jgi:hypothetical protein